jgi:hypothetical protein
VTAARLGIRENTVGLRLRIAETALGYSPKQRLPELLPALMLLKVVGCGFAPGAARRADEVAALSEHGTAALDLPHGVRAVAERGVVQFARTPLL